MEIPAGFFNVSFNKAMAFGYKTDDVDEFVTCALHIAKELQEENETLQQKLEVLGSNLENYREEEDSLRSALIGAQKLGDSILKDSRQKAEKIINDATERADQITSESATRLDKQQYELEQIQAETVEFKERLFSLYRTHLDIIKNIPSDYDANRKKPRPKSPPPVQSAAAEPEPHEEQEVIRRQSDLPQGNSYDERSSAVYVPEHTEPADEQPQIKTLAAESNNIREGREEDCFESPYIIDEPDSDKPFTAEPPHDEEPVYEDDYVKLDETPSENPGKGSYEESYKVSYQESFEEEDAYEAPSHYEAPRKVQPVEPLQPEDEDVAIYHAPTRRAEEPHPFATPPMVQLEFDTGGYDDYDEDEFAAEKKLIREANLNRIPYLDDDDDDDFAVQLTSKKKPVVSQKFGVLKFGEAFDLRDD